MKLSIALLLCLSAHGQISLGGQIAARGGNFLANARAYGATGDGVTDDTTALANACAAAQTLPSKMLYIPSGTYLISTVGASGSLCSSNTDYLEIFGDGEGRTNILLPSTFSPATQVQIFSMGGRHQKVHDMTIVGPNTYVGSSAATMVQARNGGFDQEFWNIECTNLRDNTSAGAFCVNTYQPYTQPEYTTTLGTSITSGAQTVTPASMLGIGIGKRLAVGSGASLENVLVASKTNTTFTATFANNHAASDPLVVLSKAYQRVSAHDIWCHDSGQSSCIGSDSSGNTFTRIKVQDIGLPSCNCWAFYVQSGDTVIERSDIMGSPGIQVYPAASHILDVTGVRIDHVSMTNATGYITATGGGFNNGTAVTEIASGSSMSSETNLFRAITISNSYFFLASDNPTPWTYGFNIHECALFIGNVFDGKLAPTSGTDNCVTVGNTALRGATAPACVSGC